MIVRTGKRRPAAWALAWGALLGFGAALAQDNVPVGNQEDGDAAPGMAAARGSIHAPTAIERNSRPVAPLVLAEGGKARLPIVIAAKASPATRATASELAAYLGRISGATFAVTTPDGRPADLDVKEPRFPAEKEAAIPVEAARNARPAEALPAGGIVLGCLGEFAVPELQVPLAIREGYNGREAFAIRTQTDRLLLVGATEKGVPHAAFRFLELVGCRWFFPGKNWEIVPALPRLAFGMDVTDRPTILARSIWYAWGLFADPGAPPPSRSAVDYRAWARHNLMAQSLVVNSGHAWQNIIGANEAAFRAHPEYFAEIGGKRAQFQVDKEGRVRTDPKTNEPKLNVFAKLELGNPEVRKIVVDYALDYFRQHPEADMVSLDPSDGGGHSESAESKKLGSVSDAVFGMANEAARAVAKAYPGKMVGLLAYNHHIAPPSFPLEPNVYIELTAGFNESKYTYDELFAMWPAKTRNMGFYEYFSTWLWDQDRLPGGRVASLKWVRERIPFYASRNAVSVSAESGNNWGIHGPGYLVANRLMWDPGADVDALLADFYEKAFGAGAKAMRRYYERVSPDAKNLLSTSLVGQAFRDVDEASKVTASDLSVTARLDDLKHHLRYVHLRWKYDQEKDKEKRTALALEAFRSVYATRYSYMNHWAGMSGTQGWVYMLARETQDRTLLPVSARTSPQLKDWHGDLKAPRPWEDAKEPTHEETEAWFQEGLKYFPVVEVAEKTFAYDRLVPVKLAAPEPSPKHPLRTAPENGMIEFSHQGGRRYAFSSLKGEPIKVEVVAGTLAQYRGRPPAKWTLERPNAGDGKAVVQEGQVALDNQAVPLSLAVPAAGSYVLDFNDRGAGWLLRVPVTQPVVILLNRDRPTGVFGGLSQGVFYVPKGLTEIQFFWAGYAPSPPMIRPDGALVPTGRSSEIITVPVPKGMDGRLWRFHGMDIRHLWFLNLPNVIAPNAGMMMLPREVAEKDGVATRP